MAWPVVTAGQSTLASQFNALSAALSAWGGPVDAGGYNLSNVGSLAASGPATLGSSLAIAGATARQQLTVGANLDLYSGASNSPTVASLRASSAGLYVNSPASTGLYLNYDSGSTVYFCDGASNVKGSLTSNGYLGLLTGVTAPSKALTIGSKFTVDAAGNLVCFTLSTTGIAVLAGTYVGSLSVSGVAEVAVAGTAFLDLANNNLINGVRWRLFADAVGGFGGQLTFGLYDYQNSRIAFGIDNSGYVNFPNAALINFGSNWLNWIPSVTGNGSMTISALTVTDMQYCRVGPICHVKGYLFFTTGGTASNAVFITLPIVAVGQISSVNMGISQDNGATFAASFSYVNANVITVTFSGGGNWGLGTGRRILFSCTYRCA